MPIIECGFRDGDEQADLDALINFGPTAEVVVSAHIVPSTDEEQPRSETVYALIDTGATQSCIDHKLALDLGLPVVDVQQVAGAGGLTDHDVFMAKVSIPGLKMDQFGRFTGVALAKGGQPHRVLLGRTFLQHIIMIYDGIRGQVTISC